MTVPMQTNIDPKEIQAHLSQYKGEKYVEGWASLWDKGDKLPWDRGFPNPALEDTLVKQRSTLGAPVATDAQGNSYRRKALVPGCGRGVDVLLLASFGFDAYGLEYSAAAIEACKKEEEDNANWYRVRDQAVGTGKVTWVQGDFFDDAWLQKIGMPLNGFDIIYDYTVRTLVSLRFCLGHCAFHRNAGELPRGSGCRIFGFGSISCRSIYSAHAEYYAVLLCSGAINATQVGAPTYSTSVPLARR